RPADGKAVADAVAAYRAGVEERLREVEREKAAAEARAAEQRKRLRLRLALTAALGLLAAGGGAFGWWTERRAQTERQRVDRNAESIGSLLDQCEAALRGDDAARAATVLEQAERRTAEGGADPFAA